MASLRITVGARLDAASLKAFEPLERAGERARKAIDRSLNQAGQAGANATRPIQTSWEKLEKELEKEANKILKGQEKSAKQADKEFKSSEQRKTAALEKETARREGIIRRSSEMAGREAEKAANAEIRAAAKAAKAREKAGKEMPWYARPLGGDRGLLGGGGGAIGIGRRAGLRVNRGVAAAYGYGGSLVSGAMGLGMDVAQGLGVDTSFGSLVGKAQNQRSLAQKISNSAYVPGTQLQSSHDILSGARNVANETGTDTGETLKALQDFVAKTGNLKTGQESLMGMAKLARATGANLSDMADAAAEVTNNIGDIPDKGAVVQKIMQQIAGQGKLGAVEIRDLASQMAKLAVNARKFEGGAIANISEMGILAQEAKLAGGATSATMAATSVASFSSDISKKATLKAWTAAGLSPFADKGKTTLRSPEELILEAVKYSKGDITKLNALFPNKMSTRAVAGFSGIYANTQGTEKEKLTAVSAEFERLRQAQLDDAEVTRAFGESMKTSEAAVTVFNNHMTEVAEELAGPLTKALMGIAPKLISFGEFLGNAVGNQTGQNRDDALDELAKTPVGTAAHDKTMLDRSPVRLQWNMVTGKAEPIKQYSAEEVEVIKGHGRTLGEGTAKLQGQIDYENERASKLEVIGGSVTGRIGGSIAKKTGLADETPTEQAERLRGQAKADTLKLGDMQTEFSKLAEVFKVLGTTTSSGTAEIVAAINKNGGTGGGGSGGTENPNSPPPE